MYILRSAAGQALQFCMKLSVVPVEMKDLYMIKAASSNFVMRNTHP